MNSLFRLDVPKRSLSCHRGGERLQPGMDYYSLLLDDENSKVIRQDYCLICWREMTGNRDLTTNHGYWQSRIDRKEEIKGSQSKTIKALALLKELLELPEREDAEVFVLSLFLARARRLILRKEIQRDGMNYFLYEKVGCDEFITIKKMNLNSDEITLLRQILSEKLN